MNEGLFNREISAMKKDKVLMERETEDAKVQFSEYIKANLKKGQIENVFPEKTQPQEEKKDNIWSRLAKIFS